MSAWLVPGDLAVDAQDNVFIADDHSLYDSEARVRKVSPDGRIATVVGGNEAMAYAR